MKKQFLILFSIFFGLLSMLQARFYIGVEGGSSVEIPYETDLRSHNFVFATPGSNKITSTSDIKNQGFSVALVFGNETFSNPYFGTRVGFSIGYAQIPMLLVNETKNKRQEKWQDFRYADAGFNFDVILNLYASESFTFGAFCGVSTDYHYFFNLSDTTNFFKDYDGVLSQHMLDFSGRVGATMLLAKHHRLEFIGKLPLASLNVAGDNRAKLGGYYGLARTTFGGSYKIIF